MKFSLPLILFASLLSAQTPVFRGAAAADAAINQAIQEDRLPGAVLLVGHEGKVIYKKAYGNRAVAPAKEAMALNTIFDCASLTKVVATTSGMMKLVETGKVNVDDPVTKYLPEFQGGKSTVTVRQLMTHFSGLRPDLDLEPAWSGYDTGIQKALTDKPANPPGAKFVYSDINFELLGEIIRRQSGMPENEYLKKILFEPLGMKDSGYLPAAALRNRIAPTEQQKDGTILRGVVHDPTARYMGGVAGHAGLFSTADDLSKFCQMLLDGGKGLFRPETIRTFTSNAAATTQPIQRGLGWDINSSFSTTRGDLFPIGSFGHTGFTGTSIWIDPASKTYVILLANSVHLHGRKPISPLRGRIATIVASAVGYDAKVQTGLDVLAANGFAEFKGKKIGLITNQSGLDREGRRNIDLMRDAGVEIAAIFSPEHGFAGVEDHENIDNTVDPKTGIRVWSLYGKNLRPSAEMLRGLDAMVFDIQDIGVRFYTFESTMAYALEACAKAKIPFYVLDRPNPITGLHVEGPMLDADKVSFVGSYPLPLRHGLTMGELARYFNGEEYWNADLHIIQMKGWTRETWFDQTGLPWVNPSPNIRNLTEAILYPGLALLEFSTNYSVGRGTDNPFEQVGADWIQGKQLADYLNARNIPGIRCEPVKFTPSSSNFAKKTVEGVRFTLTDRVQFSALRLGIEVATALEKLYPGKISFDAGKKLIGSQAMIEALKSHGDAAAAAKLGMEAFEKSRTKYLLYQ